MKIRHSKITLFYLKYHQQNSSNFVVTVLIFIYTYTWIIGELVILYELVILCELIDIISK